MFPCTPPLRLVIRRGYTFALLFLSSLAAFACTDRPLPAAEPPRRAGEDWWSIQPLRQVSLPAVSLVEWSQRPLDRFVYRRMAEKGLSPAPEADRFTFIRRATFDLLGLPPAPEEIHAFQNDPDPGAHERLIDRLLASPRYGERWGRHWLDTVRFGESHGYEQNHLRENSWQYRDYVIASFNADKPYDRFVVEQLAGDQLAGAEVSDENRDLFIATAFIVSGPYDTVTNGSLEFNRQRRANSLNDFVATTGSAFLGLTFNCARCHDHKFDPILQKDYYRLSAIFDGVQHRGRILDSPEEVRNRQALLAPLETELAVLREELTALERSAEPRIDQRREEILASYRPPVDDRGTEERFAPVQARFVRMDIQETSFSVPMVEEFQVWTSGSGGPSRNVALASVGARVSAMFTRVSDGDADADLYKIDLVIDGEYGETWVGSRHDGKEQFTIELAREETISRIFWTKSFQGKTRDYIPTIYSIQTSRDGEEWREVAHSRDRKPLADAALRDRFIKTVFSDEENRRRAELQGRIAAVTAQVKAVPKAKVFYVGTFVQPEEPTYFLKGGSVMDRGDPVLPASPSTLGRVLPEFELAADSTEGERRLALARWITDKRNPLTARVMANRVWHYHFGRGIVATPSDFGFNGARPTHPDLLDYLARRLQQLDWRLKAFHKEILLSRTYRQSSRFHEASAKIDADAVFLWRFPPRRLEAEAIRDSILAVSGKLDRRMEGPGFRLYRYSVDNVATYYPMETFGEETYRRAVYHTNPRSVKVELLGQYDCPDNTLPVPRRASTISPLQALNLLNNSFTMDQARFFGERLVREVGSDAGMQLRRAYSLAFGRLPEPEEERAGREMIEKHGLDVFCRALLNVNEFIYVM